MSSPMTCRPITKNGSFVSVAMNSPNSNSRRPVQEPTRDKMATSQHTKSSPAIVNKAKSVPSTPSHRPQSPQNGRRSPSLSRALQEGSPRSLGSESSITPPALKRPPGGCKYETGMAQARRRVPYALGPEKLEPDVADAAMTLGLQQQEKLTQEMTLLYKRLVPTIESEQQREHLVRKLDTLLHQRWPGQNIAVSVFGSTGNKLGTVDSDVDICITTDCKELERVCSIAELLARNGMERVVCVSSAKVPIVKVWDPELSVACDMNVNNPIALENTEMIRAYVSIDHRFRPLAMIVKYWAKRRILNDAALGGTLSSYTWICLVLNFLQTRNPPVLPALQQRKGLQSMVLNGVNVAFDKNLENYRNFGEKNKSTLGELLCEFFRYYAHQLDFEDNVVSVRLGKIISKTQKAWHLLQDNRLCVEEPFNITRNLANTADDTSMRGIHQELRRAFRLIVEGKLEQCCEQYVPKDNEVPLRHSETFIHPSTKAIIPQAPPQSQQATSTRTNRNSYRGVRNVNRNNTNAARRASNPSGRGSTYLRDLPFKMNTQELQLQAQHQQHLLHDHLFQQYQYLQRQEQELRMQLYQQSFRQSGLLPGHSHSHNSMPGSEDTSEEHSVASNSRAGSSVRVPMSAPLYQQRFRSTSPYLHPAMPSPGFVTNPGSPLLGNAMPDSRRYARRTSVNNTVNGSLRAHSQPARSVSVTPALGMPRSGYEYRSSHLDSVGSRRSSIVSNPADFASGYIGQQVPMPGTLYDAGRRPEYVGYYVGQSPSLIAHPQSTTISPIPSNAGLAIHHGGLSPHVSSRASRMSSMAVSPSLQPSEMSNNISDQSGASEQSGIAASETNGSQSPRPRLGPLVVNGSIHSPNRKQRTFRNLNEQFDGQALSVSASDDMGVDTPSSSDEQYPEAYTQSDVLVGFTDQLKNHKFFSSSPSSNLKQPNGLDENVILNVETQEDDEISLQSIHTHSEAQAASMTADPAIHWSATKSKTKTLPGSIDITGTDILAPVPTALTSKPNGHEGSAMAILPVSADNPPNGWQTQKKKRKAKRAAKSDIETGILNTAGGEVLPVDESMRKGG